MCQLNFPKMTNDSCVVHKEGCNLIELPLKQQNEENKMHKEENPIFKIESWTDEVLLKRMSLKTAAWETNPV